MSEPSDATENADHHPLRDVLGDWELLITTPIGSIPVSVTLSYADGVYSGSARTRGDDDVELRELTVTPTGDGHRITWAQSITKPLRLNLDFDVQIAQGTMTGTSRAGRLPQSKVVGRRN
jgi:hypothetical protein